MWPPVPAGLYTWVPRVTPKVSSLRVMDSNLMCSPPSPNFKRSRNRKYSADNFEFFFALMYYSPKQPVTSFVAWLRIAERFWQGAEQRVKIDGQFGWFSNFLSLLLFLAGLVWTMPFDKLFFASELLEFSQSVSGLDVYLLSSLSCILCLPTKRLAHTGWSRARVGLMSLSRDLFCESLFILSLRVPVVQPLRLTIDCWSNSVIYLWFDTELVCK